MGSVANRLNEMATHANLSITTVGASFTWLPTIDHFEDWNWLVDAKHGTRPGLNTTRLTAQSHSPVASTKEPQISSRAGVGRPSQWPSAMAAHRAGAGAIRKEAQGSR